MVSQIEREFEEFESQQQWQQVYQKIKNESMLVSISEKHSVGEARKPENRSKNRYRDVSPYDHSRVILQEGDSDYINASIIQVPESNRTYILSQGPLEHTAGQFWQMIWEQNSKAIVMLNRVIEKGAVKCHQYWPLADDEEEEEMVFEDHGLKITLHEEQEMSDYTIRTFDLENLKTEEVREVYHFHYMTWPDFGIPSSPISFLEFLQEVRDRGVLSPDVGPAVVHCSAGIGRSGTFCLVDSALILVEKTGTMHGIDIQSLLLSMRSYRMGLIQTHDQLKFSYMAIIAGGRQIMQARAASGKHIGSVHREYNDDQLDDEVPVPPERKESLLSRGQKPPPPPVRSFKVDDSPEPPNKQQKLDDSTGVPEKPPRAHVFLKDENTSEYLTPYEGDTAPESYVNCNTIHTNRGVIVANNTNHEDRDSDIKAAGHAEENVANNLNENQNVGEETQTEQSEHNEHSVSDQSHTELRQRRKEEREKRKEKTKEVIKKMKEKQQQNEIWKKRKSYFKPIAIGLTLMLGSFILYRFFW